MNMNPEFSGLDRRTVLNLNDEMPFGKHKGVLVANLIEDEPQYMRWFVDNVLKYSLSDEALLLLNEVESEDSLSDPHDSAWTEDIPW